MLPVSIGAFWRNDQPVGRFYLRFEDILDDERIAALKQIYDSLVHELMTDPTGKEKYLSFIEAFAQDWHPIGVQIKPEPDAILIILMVAALERLGMIQSDDFNGVIGIDAVLEYQTSPATVQIIVGCKHKAYLVFDVDHTGFMTALMSTTALYEAASSALGIMLRDMHIHVKTELDAMMEERALVLDSDRCRQLLRSIVTIVAVSVEDKKIEDIASVWFNYTGEQSQTDPTWPEFEITMYPIKKFSSSELLGPATFAIGKDFKWN